MAFPTELTIAAGARTDWFVDPGTDTVVANAASSLERVSGDFVLAAHVEVEFTATFDAGALVAWEHEREWAKLAYEYSPDGEPMVVSVVTRGTSDDCNSFVVESGSVWLRLARIGRAFAFHASTDGVRWRLVRHFRLGHGDPQVGFEAQSPLGDGCTARFSQIRCEAVTLQDLRDGT